MAIDKAKLHAYFHTHYLSRQEVLFKLPFSVPIESFWPELLNRRKANGTVLPLYDATGKPYWYVLTDKMVAASEKLCEEAMDQEKGYDPYRAPMTGAMTEEMFFTSFVEGAQISLKDAMNFLGRGTEPENVQEQMIWNNRQAVSIVMKGLYRTLDESYIKGLAFTLTNEMEGCADDYRQTDEHYIAAMTNERYSVPPASVLPERMREYVEFLQKSDIHPLIKAAAGQAYLLVTRPFQEGNERLSRMISSAVLLRSGYDYFRDISISGMIARESYRYYKAMCEILRAENGNDLTYFMEYYLDMLSRAIDVKKERDLNREKERLEREKAAIETERKLAKEPLKPRGVEIVSESAIADSLSNAVSPASEPANISSISTDHAPLASGMTVNNPPLMPQESQMGLPPELVSLTKKPNKGNAENAMRRQTGLALMIKQHCTDIRAADWSQMLQVDRITANVDIRRLVKCGLLYSVGRTSNAHFVVAPQYLKYFAGDIDAPELTVEQIMPERETQIPVYDYTNSHNARQHDRLRRSAINHLREMVSEEAGAFTRRKWMGRFDLSKTPTLREINLLIDEGYLVKLGSNSSIMYEATRMQTPNTMLDDRSVLAMHPPKSTHGMPTSVPTTACGVATQAAISA